MIFVLAGIATLLTCTMFATRQAMLGYACAMFWVLLGAYCYLASAGEWADIYYFLFIASSIGMTVFSIMAAFGLREKRDTFADEEIDEDVGEETHGYVDEDVKPIDDLFSVESNSKPSRRTVELRKRAEERRTGTSSRRK